MIRQIIKIDREKCNGCGKCVTACHEGAIGMIDGKAVLLKENHCDGLGDCLPACPVGAITFEKREAAPYDENAVKGTLKQWPVQIKLVPVNAPYFDGASLLVAADCTAYAYAGFHDRFMKNHVTLIGCPKLDSVDYSEKLTSIIREKNIRSVTVARMEVPCCGGMENAVKKALKESGKMIPWSVVTVSTDGKIKEE